MGQQAVCEDPSPRDLPADSMLPTGTGKMLIGAEIIRRAAETVSKWRSFSRAVYRASRGTAASGAAHLGIITGAERPIEPAFNLSEI